MESSDKTTENTRPANEYLNVSFNNKNNWIKFEFYQKWDYWKFDFSPCKIDGKQEASQKESYGDSRQERWKFPVDIAKEANTEGTDYHYDGIKVNNYQQPLFTLRKIQDKSRGTLNVHKKQQAIPKQGTIGLYLSLESVLNFFLWLSIYRMDKGKRKLGDYQQIRKEEGGAMDVDKQEIEEELDIEVIDLLQDDKYWSTIGTLADKISQFNINYIKDQTIINLMGLKDNEDAAIVAAQLQVNRTTSIRKKDAIVALLESFLQHACTAGTQEMKETYDVIGHAVRITYELCHLRIIREIENDLQGCKTMVDDSIDIQEEVKEDVRNALEQQFFECRTYNLTKMAEQYNKLRTSLLTGIAYDLAICQMDVRSEAQGLEKLEARIKVHEEAATAQQAIVVPVKETYRQIVTAPSKLPARPHEESDDTTTATTETAQLTREAAITLRDTQRGKGHLGIAPTEWKTDHNTAEHQKGRAEVMERLTYADEWIDTAQYVLFIGLNLSESKEWKDKDCTLMDRVLREVTNAFTKVGHSPYIGKEEVREPNEWIVDVTWLKANLSHLKAKAKRPGFSDGIPIKLMKRIGIAAVGTFNTWKVGTNGSKVKIGKQTGSHIYDMIHMVRSDSEVTAKQYPREYWIMALPDGGYWEQLWSKAAPLWTLTGLHSLPEDKYVMAAEIICARKQTLEELNAKGAGLTEANILPILEQYWTEWNTDTDPMTFVPKNRKANKGRTARKPIFLLRMVYANKKVIEGAAHCPIYKRLMKDRFERKFVACGYRMERFVNEADMEMTPVPNKETLTAHQTICHNVIEGAKAKDVLEELLLSTKNWNNFHMAGQIIMSPGTWSRYKNAISSLRIVWLKEEVQDLTEDGDSILSERNYCPVDIRTIKEKYATYESSVIMIEDVSDTRQDFLEIAERFMNNASQITTPTVRNHEESPTRMVKRNKKSTPTKTPVKTEIQSLTSNSLSTISTHSADNQITKFADDNLSQFFSKMIDIEGTIKDLATKQKAQEQDLQKVREEQERELQLIRQAAQTAKVEQSTMQLQLLLREIGAVAGDIELLQGQIEDNEETVQELMKQSGSEFMQYQKMQADREIRRDRRTVETKLRQLRNLRSDAIRLAAGITPPVILEGSVLRNDL